MSLASSRVPPFFFVCFDRLWRRLDLISFCQSDNMGLSSQYRLQYKLELIIILVDYNCIIDRIVFDTNDTMYSTNLQYILYKHSQDNITNPVWNKTKCTAFSYYRIISPAQRAPAEHAKFYSCNNRYQSRSHIICTQLAAYTCYYSSQKRRCKRTCDPVCQVVSIV